MVPNTQTFVDRGQSGECIALDVNRSLRLGWLKSSGYETTASECLGALPQPSQHVPASALVAH